MNIDDPNTDAGPGTGAGTAPPARPAPAAGAATGRRPIDRRHVMMLVLPIIPMWASIQIGTALFPTLSTENPTLLIALSPANRNLIIAAASAQHWLELGTAVPAILYGILGTARLLAPDPFFYAIGTHYGDRAIEWMERRTPTFGEMMRELERWFAKAAWLFVLILPNNFVCLLAGAAQMRRRWFWPLNLTGTVGRVIVMWFVGRALQDWIDLVLGFVADHRVPFLVASFAIVAVTLGREWRAGTTEVQSLIELEHELEQDLDDRATTPDSADPTDRSAPSAPEMEASAGDGAATGAPPTDAPSLQDRRNGWRAPAADGTRDDDPDATSGGRPAGRPS